jgi:phosphatidylserine/phosphatidylglycerophosphate/cardiolipin synthase-like enzyme
VALIGGARREIDLAAYVLTDWPVMQALTRTAERGVKVRIYLDGTQLAERAPSKVKILVDPSGNAPSLSGQGESARPLWPKAP